MTGARWAIAAAAAAAVCAVAISGCASGTTSAPDPRLAGDWHLIDAVQNGAPLPLNGSDITLSIASAATTGGESMCAPYAAKVIGGVGSVFVKVRNESTTRDACIPNALVNVGEEYLNTLGASRFASIANGELTLYSKRDSLLYVRAAPQASSSLANTSWILYSAPQQTSVSTARSGPVTLSFGANNLITIASPCVNYVSHLEIAGSTAAAPAFAATNKDSATCSDRDREAATIAATGLLGPMLITVSPAAAHGDPATLIITNVNSSIPTVWRSRS